MKSRGRCLDQGNEPGSNYIIQEVKKIAAALGSQPLFHATGGMICWYEWRRVVFLEPGKAGAPGYWDSSLWAKAAICRRVLSASLSRILCTWLLTVKVAM